VKKMIALVLVPVLVLSVIIAIRVTTQHSQCEEPIQLVAKFVPQYDPPPPRKPPI